MPLSGVPDGCVARPALVADGSGWRLPRDRSGRAKLDAIELTATDNQKAVSLPPGPERGFVLGRQARRWPTIVDHYGDDDAAWSAAVKLCRAGLVTVTCTVVTTRLGPPTRWRWTALTRSHADTHRQRAVDAQEAARRVLQADGREPAWVDDWLRDIARSGLLARTAQDEALLTAAASCLAALPLSAGELIGRGELASRYGVPKGAHALDDGHRLAALVLRGAAAITGTPYPRTAAQRRALWLSVGVICDTISATVLVANLRPAPTSLVARQLSERADARLPTHLTARDLSTTPLQIPEASVYVCENPWILEAAIDHGVTAALVCTAGNPTTVTIDLLRQLTDSGAQIFYRGDFDWPGISIGNRVIERTNCGTWLFDTDTYLYGLRSADGDVIPLTDKAIPASWDDTLCDALQNAGDAIHEELLVDQLIAYLLTMSQ